MSPVDTLVDVVRSELKRVGIRRALIGVDVSFNEDREGRFRPHWLFHVRVIAARRLSKATIAELRRGFPKSPAIPRPLKHARFDGNRVALAYTMKPNFERRQGYLDHKRSAHRERTCHNTRGRPLKGEQAVELALFLDRLGLRRRLILHGTRLVMTNGRVRIATGPRKTRNVRHPP